MARRILVGVVVLLGMATPVRAVEEYVEITSRRANIRSGARTSSAIVTTARRGDVFSLRAEEGDWYEIHLLSGGRRFVHSSLARKVSYQPQLPASISLRQELFRALQEMEARVRREADERYPPEKQLERNLGLVRRLRDHHGLEILHRFDLALPVYRGLMIEGIQNDW